jgi:Methyltransferase domain
VLLDEKEERVHWSEIDGWFLWRAGQEEAVAHFPEGATFVEVGTYLGRSICSLADVVASSGRRITIVGVDTCRGSGPEGPKQKDYHGAAVAEGGGTLAGTLHRNILACGYGNAIAMIIADSAAASRLCADATLDWVHLDARHDHDGVTADIVAWLPKVKPGGWLTGDDYDTEKWPEVVAAVKAALPGAAPWLSGQWRWLVPAAATELSAPRLRDLLRRR